VAPEARLLPSGPARQPVRPLPDWATVHAEHKQPGVTRQEQIFVGALGASHYLYVEAT